MGIDFVTRPIDTDVFNVYSIPNTVSTLLTVTVHVIRP